jgi:hypothetical protein
MIANVCVCVCVCVVFFIARVPLFSRSLPLSLCPLRQHVNRMCAPWLMRVDVCVRVCVCCPHLLGLFQVECLKQASKAASKMVGAKKKVCCFPRLSCRSAPFCRRLSACLLSAVRCAFICVVATSRWADQYSADSNRWCIAGERSGWGRPCNPRRHHAELARSRHEQSGVGSHQRPPQGTPAIVSSHPIVDSFVSWFFSYLTPHGSTQRSVCAVVDASSSG